MQNGIWKSLSKYMKFSELSLSITSTYKEHFLGGLVCVFQFYTSLWVNICSFNKQLPVSFSVPGAGIATIIVKGKMSSAQNSLAVKRHNCE